MSDATTLQHYRVIVGGRIRQARIMAGFNKITEFSERFPDWSNSRLGNYENGTSLPNPLDIKRIAKETDTSPCWIMFGVGTIRSTSRDLQAVRYQNFAHLIDKLAKSQQVSLRNALKLKPKEFKAHLDNPFLKLTDTLCRKMERHLGKRKHWMDEQHIDNDGLCEFFPDDIREILMIYSSLPSDLRDLFLDIARTFTHHHQ
jgi:hypothetical protein